MQKIAKIVPFLSFILVFVMCLSFHTYADQTVYTTASGKKYHSTAQCSGLNNAKNIYEKSESEAIASGLTKCAICWEDSSESSTVATTSQDEQSSTSSSSSSLSSSSSSSSSSSTTVETTTTTTTTETSADPAPVVDVTPAPTEEKPIQLYSKRIKVKKGKKLKIQIKNANGKVKWSLSNKKAKITKKKNSYIIIKGKKKGKVTVKAKIGGRTYKLKIKVR